MCTRVSTVFFFRIFCYSYFYLTAKNCAFALSRMLFARVAFAIFLHTRRNAKELRESIVERKQGYIGRDLGRWYSGKITVTGGWANGSWWSISILITLLPWYVPSWLSPIDRQYTLSRDVSFTCDLKIFSKCSANYNSFNFPLSPLPSFSSHRVYDISLNLPSSSL